jgi:hypothetical protein
MNPHKQLQQYGQLVWMDYISRKCLHRVTWGVWFIRTASPD